MFHPIAQKYEAIFKTVNNDSLAIKLGEELAALPEKDFKDAAIQDTHTGRCVFYGDDAGTVVLELVGGTVKADSIVSLYQPNAIFSNRSGYIEARKELMAECAKVLGAPGSQDRLAVMDHSRGRHVLLNELSTAQLIDILNDSERRIQLPGR